MKIIQKLAEKPFFRVLVTLCMLIAFVGVLDHYGSRDSEPEYPKFEKADLDDALDIGKIYMGYANEETLEFIFCQTGLGKEAVEEIILTSRDSTEFLEVLEKYQEQLFLGNDNNELVTLKDGDVLVSMSQRFCYYTHGHAAIVIDGKEGKILEAKSYAAGSCVGTTKRWLDGSSFVVLRVKEEIAAEYDNPAAQAALYARENLVGLKYSLLKDIRLGQDEMPEYTQCAHLVWYAYYACGLDIDENRGLIIKPKDFLKSDVFEVVQVFGINPETLLEIKDE